ncbi:MAG: ATP-binding protein [Acidimicrobiales bacterium]
MSGGGHQFDDPRSSCRAFEPTVGAATAARRYAGRVLSSWGVSCPGDALLLVAELTTNAVRHARTRFVLSLGLQEGVLRVAVTDTDRALPHLVEPKPTATGGRGLVIVNALSESWGWEPSPQGKTVWAAVGTKASWQQTRSAS